MLRENRDWVAAGESADTRWSALRGYDGVLAELPGLLALLGDADPCVRTRIAYLAPAKASGITPGGPPMSEADWAGLIEGWFPGLIDRRLRKVTWSDIDEHRSGRHYASAAPGPHRA
jgi:hypothetical protein